ncbi:hypothetical protein CNMCM7691_001522 [Aspergillus felis]|uniref:Uncharacterized protein n=1 Tax=Aspergillus felis TaxID=1287682 RepID=A0A8H6R0G2_9EURO|nr:hypothetical protein CNMCM7691_001522 [Aspergillus felis]
MSSRNPSDSASDSAQESSADAVLVYRPVEALKAWARDNRNHLPKDKQEQLKAIISQIEAGPEAGKPMAIGSLRDDQIRQIFKLGKDRAMDISIYKATIVPEAVTVAQQGDQGDRDGPTQVEPFARTLVSLMLIEAICEQSGYNGDDEAEAQDPKSRDIVFLDQETRLSETQVRVIFSLGKDK